MRRLLIAGLVALPFVVTLPAAAPVGHATSAAERAIRPAGLAVQPSMRPWRYIGANPDGWWCPAGSCRGVRDGTIFVERELPLIRELGVRLIRIEFPWPLLEPRRGRYDWRRADFIVRQARAHGIQVVPVVVFTPSWAGAAAASPPPPQVFGRFVRALASRYRRSLGYYELWNEPDLSRYFDGSSAAYVRTVLRPGFRAIRAVDPTAKVIIGGPAKADEAWLEGIYTAGGGRSFDVMSYHDYSGDEFVLRNVEIVQRVLRRHGQARKPVWLGEYGREESGLDGPRQEALIRHALTGRAPFARVIWYTLRDDRVMRCCPPETLFTESFGLLTDSYVKKRGFETMRRLLGGS